MKKILSVIIAALCAWIIVLLNPTAGEISEKIAIIPSVVGILATTYFIILCITSEEDQTFD